MTRIPLLEPGDTSGKARSLLEGIARKRGYVPTPVQVMAHSPAVLDGYVALATALVGGVLDARMRERIALGVATANNCQPCLVAHTGLAKAAGLSDGEVAQARGFSSAEPDAAVALAFARAIFETQGHVSDEQFAAARDGGVSDAAMVEIAAHIAMNLLTNVVNSIADVEVATRME
jgi:AhpD family alkylhydroperoxidase